MTIKTFAQTAIKFSVAFANTVADERHRQNSLRKHGKNVPSYFTTAPRHSSSRTIGAFNARLGFYLCYITSGENVFFDFFSTRFGVNDVLFFFPKTQCKNNEPDTLHRLVIGKALKQLVAAACSL